MQSEKEIVGILQMVSRRMFSAQEALEMLQKLHDCDSGVERDSDGSWSVFSSSDSGSESEPPPAKKTRVVPLAGGCGALFQGSKRLAYVTILSFWAIVYRLVN
ncbi:hypothetical protein ILYODFUR_038542 [Ilyodon furcidens]|uniref:Uncharacterized protein n=1 Tax=Ilyodon furcidens TaxID=33524 RepID=A0ABV0TFX6_9TELE